MNVRPLLACIFAMIFAAACDDGFSPIQESDLKFSVFGYLDAAADTQWIRISPVRTTTTTAPGSLGATVTLEHLGTGRTVELRDSVFRFIPNPEVGSEGVFLHNFWTAERIEPGATYRFSVKRDDGRSSDAEVIVPKPYQVEVWLRQKTPLRDLLRLEGLRHVAFAEVRTQFFDQCAMTEYRAPFGTGSPESEVQMIPIYKPSGARPGCGTPTVQREDIWIVGSGAPWPSGGDYSAERLGVPYELSNITNSIGFLGGVLTRTVPYESCRFAGFAPPEDYCRLRYDAASARLSGTVTDPMCGTNGVVGATVELLELDPDPPASPKIRFTLTNGSGGYAIAALEGGRRYALSVSRFIKSVPTEQYETYTDTLEFAAGQRRTYDVGLLRLQCPPR